MLLLSAFQNTLEVVFFLSAVWQGALHGTPRNGEWFPLLLLCQIIKAPKIRDHYNIERVLQGQIYSLTYGELVKLQDEASHCCLWEPAKDGATHWRARCVWLPTLNQASVCGVAGAASQLWRGGAGASWAGGGARDSSVPGGRPAGHSGERGGAAGRSSEGRRTGQPGAL